jgi:glycosyltransferase involved in cell wall biosynthesis
MRNYSSKDLAVVIPTYNRPEKVRDLLDSLARQNEAIARILIIDGGESVEDVVSAYADRLPVEYFACNPPGQIRQRNYGISMLEPSTPLVASLDDDIVLEPGAIQSMIDFWNGAIDQPAAVAFNITNSPKHRYSRLKALLNMSAKKEGYLLKSGYNTGFGNVNADIKIQYVYGGASVWRLDILKKFPHREIKSKWATCEDLIYSYPIGKLFPLYVCAAAKVRHEHVYLNRKDPLARYRGKNSLLWRLYFIESNPEFSTLLYLLQQALIAPLRFIKGLLTRNFDEIKYASGQAEGILISLFAKLKLKSIFTLIHEDSSK